MAKRPAKDRRRRPTPKRRRRTPEPVKDPMSGYAGADALEPERRSDAAGPVTTEPAQDSMSGYASADALEPRAKPRAKRRTNR
jgi:hypothetical protein